MNSLSRQFLHSEMILCRKHAGTWTRHVPLTEEGLSEIGSDVAIAFYPQRKSSTPCFDGIRILNAACALSLLPQLDSANSVIVANRSATPSLALLLQDAPVIEITGFEWRYPAIGAFYLSSIHMAEDLVYTGESSLDFERVKAAHLETMCLCEGIRCIDASSQTMLRRCHRSFFKRPEKDAPIFRNLTLDLDPIRIIDAISFRNLDASKAYAQMKQAIEEVPPVFSLVSFDCPEELDTLFGKYWAGRGELVSKASEVAEIWSEALLHSEIGIDLDEDTADPYAAIERFGRDNGLDYILDAYFDGVPLEFLVPEKKSRRQMP